MVKNKNLYSSLVKTYKAQEISSPLVEFIGSVITAIVIFIGGKWVIEGSLTQGEFMTVIAALGHAQMPLKRINSSNMELQGAIAAINRVRSILNIKTEKILNGKPIQKIEKQIEFKNLYFSYPDSDPNIYALKGINFTIKKGQTVAIVGPSGSGKTTIINLLLRFFDKTKGNILIDGVDINDIAIKHVRKLTSIVTQDNFLFNDTVSANISAGKNLPKKKISESIEAAYAKNFIKELPEGLETQIGDTGIKLSGGEQQRLSIARAFAKDSPFLILDEATSALDNESELQIKHAIETLMKDKTTLVIAHRLSTIQNADKIIVMNNGKIVQEGNHASLLNQKGLYKKLYGEL